MSCVRISLCSSKVNWETCFELYHNNDIKLPNYIAGTSEEAIISILVNHSFEQRKEIATAFKTAYGKVNMYLDITS